MLTVKDLPALQAQAETWEKRREEIKQLLQQEEYGFFPPVVPMQVEAELVDRKAEKAFAGKATHQKLTFTLTNGARSFSFPARLVIPNAAEGKVPFFVFINFRPDVPDRYYPTEELIDRGVGVLSFCHQDISVDRDEFGEGLECLFLEGERNDTCFGKITLWAYAMQRALDYLLTREEVDPARVVAIGHSRLGKTALLAAAFDERFSMAVSNCSGCSGASIARETVGERVVDICTRFPYWFCKNYYRYAEHEDEMPFDQHFLLALIAPRRVLVNAALEDVWADSYNQYLACLAASEAWEAPYGRPGLLPKDEVQVLEKLYADGNIMYRERHGTHFFSRADWNLAVDLIK